MEDHVCVSGSAILLISCHYRKPHCTFDMHMHPMLQLVYFATDQARRTFFQNLVAHERRGL